MTHYTASNLIDGEYIDINAWAKRLDELGAEQVIFELRQSFGDEQIRELFSRINFYPDPESWDK